ncbi:MAG TPA: alpha/beta hydrolase [Povalibacter sp.]|nr:alpha/beta hydrolase [Povalibacter sp.]
MAQNDAPTQPSPSASGIASKGESHAAEIMKRFPAPGQMIDIGGRRLHLFCKGDPQRPSLVIEGAAFASSYSYFKAQDEMAKVAQVCVYDRAGLGWSDQAPLPRPLEDRVDDLHRLLNSGPVRLPVILAGHSMGGLLVRMYEKKYPSEVAGLILIESSNERANATEEARKQVTRTAAQIGMAFPVLAAGGEIPQVRIPNGPPEQEIIQRESVFRAGQDDLLAMSGIDEELRKFGDLGTLGDKPLIVITRGKRDPGMSESMEKEWAESHRWLATLSSRSTLVVAENSGHMVNFDRPDLLRDATERLLKLLGE